MTTPRSREDRLRLYQEWKKSSLNKREFTDQKKINYRTFTNWVATFKAEEEYLSSLSTGLTESPQAQFLPVKSKKSTPQPSAAPSPSIKSEAPIQLNLPGKVTLQSQTLPSAEWTAHLCLLLSYYDQHK